MTRPMYETRSDRENQTVVAQMFVDRYFLQLQVIT
jgi:hypothetical protein